MEEIASRFEIGGNIAPAGEYIGPILVSDDAVYLVSIRPMTAAHKGAALGAGAGGLVGGLIAAGIGAIIDKQKEKSKPEDTFWEPLTTLPERVIAHSSLRRSKPAYRVHTLRKENVNLLKFSHLSGVKIVSDAVSVSLQLMPWGVAKAQRVFQDHAWPQATG